MYLELFHCFSALLYGTIGVVIGHELTHGFDNKGRLYDKHGRLHEQWTSAAEKGFNTAASCIADQYSAYSTQGHQVGTPVINNVRKLSRHKNAL